MDCVNHPGEDAPYNCYYCKAPICVDCETKLEGFSICPECRARLRERVAARYAAETRNINYTTALLVGLLAALSLGLAWSQLAVWVGQRVPVFAVVLGALVAYAVMVGAGGKRSRPLQQLASVIALLGVLAAHYLILVRIGASEAGIPTEGISPLVAAAYALPAHISSLGPLEWLFVALGTLLAYRLPQPRSVPPDTPSGSG
jgi:hypothetical protein